MEPLFNLWAERPVMAIMVGVMFVVLVWTSLKGLFRVTGILTIILVG